MMATKQFSYADYLKDYEEITSNQKLVKKLLRAPTISKKKPSIFQADATGCRNLPVGFNQPIFLENLSKTRNLSSAEIHSRSTKDSRFDIKRRPKFTNSSKILLSNFLEYMRKIE